MQPMTMEELGTIVTQIEIADEEFLDELLTDMLVCAYPTKVTQDN